MVLSSQQTSSRIILSFLVPFILFFLSAGGLLSILIFFGVPLEEFLVNNSYKFRGYGYVLPLRGLVWSLTVGTVGIVAVLVFLYKNQKIYPKDLGLTWSLGQQGWQNTLRLQAKVFLILIIGLVIILNVAYHFFQITPHYLASINLSGFHIEKPIVEEIIFRGVFCTLLVRYGLRWSYTVFTVGLFFGFIHYVSVQYSLLPMIAYLTWCTVVGWFLGWMFYKTRTLIMPILWHYFANLAPFLTLLRPVIAEKIFEFVIF